jgi:hypothetical protein
MDNREIDALIAEKLFGWEWMQGRANNLVPPNKVKAAQAFGMHRGRNPDLHTTAPSTLPHFSTDPAASDQLLDRMRGLGWKYRIMWNGEDFTVTMQRGTPLNGWGFSEAESDTQRMAVAMACLKAVVGK